MLQKSQDGDADAFIIVLCLKFRFCITTVSNIMVIIIVKWCSGIAYDWSASLYISYILALKCSVFCVGFCTLLDVCVFYVCAFLSAFEGAVLKLYGPWLA